MSATTLREVLAAHPDLPAPDGESFEQPWHATVFALTVALQERGLIDWPQWAEALAARLPQMQEDGAAYDAAGYFEAWAAALADVLEQKGLVAPGEIDRTERRWHKAAARTPHGRAIELAPHD